ncbi:MAG TPA: DUF4139 domain-containing protein [Polyangia bacterium]|nr:DUF4139 domain-containing protein [Polyangia bacterium]
MAAALAAAGCGTVGPVDAHGLPLHKVVIYRNGVGYFERAGRVDGEHVDFRVRKNEVGDFLATLAVLERGGSSVRSASFPLAVEKETPPAPSPRRDFAPPPLAGAKRSSELETVVMSLDGGQHDLQVGYIAVTPVWRPSYRLVLDDQGATLQAWGIVQNLSGEDWKNVSLSLIAEAPLAFDASLATAVIPPRPTVTDGGDVIAVVPQAETSLAQNAPAPPPPMAEPEADRADEAEMEAPAASSARGGGFAAPKAKKMARVGAAAPMTMAAPAPAYSNRPKNLSALAAIALQAGATRYDLAAPVSIPDESATMVMLLDKPIPGEAISLFAPDPGVPESASHPFRVARFKNETGGLLERGPLAIFQHAAGSSDAFLGQGMTDALPAGATATVPFALERTLAVERETDYREEGARLFKIEGEQLEIARDVVTTTKYRVRNGGARAAKVLVKHPRVGGARLVSPPAGTEDNVGTGSALVPTTVAPNQTATLVVDERQPSVRGVDWLDPLADDAVRAYLAPTNKTVDAAAARALTAAWAIRKTLLAATDDRNAISAQEADLRRGTEETRANLKALEKNGAAADLRAKLTSRLSADSAQLDRLTKRAVEVDLSITEQRVRLKDALHGLKVVVPPET